MKSYYYLHAEQKNTESLKTTGSNSDRFKIGITATAFLTLGGASEMTPKVENAVAAIPNLKSTRVAPRNFSDFSVPLLTM